MPRAQTPELIWSRDARDDLARLHQFLARHSPRAARRAASAILEAAGLMLQFPLIGKQCAEREDRELHVPFGRSGYVIRYYVNSGDIVILRLWHEREDR